MLFQEIYKLINREKDIHQIQLLANLPIPAKHKIHKLSKEVLQKLEEDDIFAGMIALITQILLEQGQKEGSIVQGNPLKLADYYWSVVYLYALKKLFTTKYELISVEDLERTVLK